MTEIATIPKNSREELRVSIDEFHAHQLVSLRVWFAAGDGDMRPSKKGLAFRVEILPDLINALRDADTEARRRGLIREDAA